MLMNWGELLDNGVFLPLGSVDRKKGFDAVAVDSRKVKKGTLFFALKGERTDGHLYVRQVVASGAAGIVVDSASGKADLDCWKSEAGESVAVFVSRNPLESLQKAASIYRGRFSETRFIGVTGSCGKTSCKEILGHLLSEKYKTVISPGNLNSDIGMPMALFELKAGTEAAVYEMGINRIGEMDILVSLLRPDAVVVTNIGSAHVGMFGSREKIASEKKKAVESLGNNGFAVIPGNDDFNSFLKENLACRVLEFGEDFLSGFQGVVSSGPVSSRLRFWGKEVEFCMPGYWNVQNLFAAITCSLEMGLSEDEILNGIVKVVTVAGRSEFLEGDVTILNDCYNANPDSMKASFRFFCEWDGCRGKKIAVLGDMGELGGWTSGAHREMGEWTGMQGDCLVLFTGKEMKSAFDAFSGKTENAFYAADIQSAEEILKGLVKKGDCVLLKASRSMELENLIPLLQTIK